jgi:hypothetical protein
VDVLFLMKQIVDVSRRKSVFARVMESIAKPFTAPKADAGPTISAPFNVTHVTCVKANNRTSTGFEVTIFGQFANRNSYTDFISTGIT